MKSLCLYLELSFCITSFVSFLAYWWWGSSADNTQGNGYIIGLDVLRKGIKQHSKEIRLWKWKKNFFFSFSSLQDPEGPILYLIHLDIAAASPMSSMCWVLNKCLLNEYIFSRNRIVLLPNTSKTGGTGENVECMSSSKTAIASASGLNLNDRIVAYTSKSEDFLFFFWFLT